MQRRYFLKDSRLNWNASLLLSLGFSIAPVTAFAEQAAAMPAQDEVRMRRFASGNRVLWFGFHTNLATG
jgi:hypothetical protein